MPKKIIISLIVALFLFFILAVGITVYFVIKGGEKKPPAVQIEESAEIKPLSPEVIERLTVPEEAEIKPLDPETIKRLTVPEQK